MSNIRRSLKIAYFLDNFYPQLNGVVTSSINTIFEMSRRGHKTYSIVPKTNNDFKLPHDYFPFPIYSQKGFQAFFYPDFIFTYPFSKKILRCVSEFSPDIIHFHAPFTIGYQALWIARSLNKPIVGTFHTFFAEPEYLSVIGMKHSRFLQKIGWWYSNQFFNKCNAVISPGMETANFLLKKELNNHLAIISNGVNIEKYKDREFNGEFPVKIGDNEDWIVFIGRISEEKCLPVLFESIRICRQKNPGIRLLIIGDGPSKKKYEKMNLKNNLQDTIFFSGAVPNEKLLGSGILKKMKIFVTPSTSENQPMTILEAIMSGLPVIGVNAKGVPELIEGNGFIIPPNDAKTMAEKIMLTLDDKNLYEKFSKRSLMLADKYDIRNTSDKMEELYFNVIDEFRQNK